VWRTPSHGSSFASTGDLPARWLRVRLLVRGAVTVRLLPQDSAVETETAHTFGTFMLSLLCRKEVCGLGPSCGWCVRACVRATSACLPRGCSCPSAAGGQRITNAQRRRSSRCRTSWSAFIDNASGAVSVAGQREATRCLQCVYNKQGTIRQRNQGHHSSAQPRRTAQGGR
jgi:hypothetical protein